MFPYQSDSEFELSLSVGDYVVIREVSISNQKHIIYHSFMVYDIYDLEDSFTRPFFLLIQVTSSGWAEGECKGKAGWFPYDYIERRDRVLATKVIEVF